jgi:hypothetical protein
MRNINGGNNAESWRNAAARREMAGVMAKAGEIPAKIP